MNRPRRHLLAIFLAAMLAACGGGGGGGGSTGSTGTPPPSAPAGQRTSFTIASAETGIGYNVSVFLPAGYDQGQARYPVVYATDAEYRFDVLSGVLESTGRKVILVNVWNMGGDRRWVDYTWPGGDKYYRFLTRELVPRVDAQYRTDTASRVLTGHSLSGQYALMAVYLDRRGSQSFNAFIPQDGSFWFDADQRQAADPLSYAVVKQLEAEVRAISPELPVTIAMSGDSTGNYARDKLIYDDVVARNYGKLRIQLRQYSLGHVPMDGPAFKDALDFIYGP